MGEIDSSFSKQWDFSYIERNNQQVNHHECSANASTTYTSLIRLPPVRSVTTLFTGLGAAILLLQILGTIHPSHTTWGFHLLSFYSLPVIAATFGCEILVLIPATRTRLISVFSRFVGIMRLIPMWIIALILIGLLFAGGSLFAPNLHLLGDSMLILQLTPSDPSVRDASANFRNQPLTYYALTTVQDILGGGMPVEPRRIYQVIDFGAGALFILLIFWLTSRLAIPPLEQFLIGSFLLFDALLQFFTGYVENYALLSLAISAYLIFGWLALQQKLSPILPFLALLLMIGLHVSAAIFAPSGLVLLYFVSKQRKRMAMSIFGVLSIAALATILAGGISLPQLLQRVSDATRYDFLPLFSGESGIPYGMFSQMHIVDWCNAVVHIAPFAFLGSVVLLTRFRGLFNLSDPAWMFLAACTVTGITFTFIVSPGLGMARDWDFVACFFLPSKILAAFLFVTLLRQNIGREALVVVVVFMIAHTIAWLGINANDERHLRRAEMLTLPALSGTFPKIHFENLALARYGRGEFGMSRQWYERYMEYDSTNPRIIANLSDLYRRQGDSPNVYRMLLRSASLQSRNPGVYSNLGAEYARKGDTTAAIELFRRALTVDSNYAFAHANLALIYLARSDFSPSAFHADRAINGGMADPILLKYAGFSYGSLKQYATALKRYDAYLLKVPQDMTVRSARDRLMRRLQQPARMTPTPEGN